MAGAIETPRAGDLVTRIALPVFLALGALAKLFTGSPYDLPQLLSEGWSTLRTRPPTWAESAFTPLRVFAAVVVLELILAAVIALHRRASRPTAIAVLAVLLTVGLHQSWSGAGACGCFGRLAVPAWLTLTLNAVLLAGVLLLPRRPAPVTPLPTARWAALFAAALAASVLTAGVVRYRLATPAGAAGLPAWIDPGLVGGVGSRWDDLPVARYLDVSPASFPEDEQHWVFYRTSCPICHDVFADRFSGRPAADGTVREPGRVIAVETPLPRHARANDAGTPEAIDCDSCVHAALPEGPTWMVPVPLVVKVERGIITQVERVR